MTHLRIKELAEAKDWTVNRLAKRAQLDRSVVHRYWHNGTPEKPLKQYDINVLDKLAVALGVDAKDLLTGAPSPNYDDRRAVQVATAVN